MAYIMKRINNLFEQICSYENLLLADKKARRGKSNSDEVNRFDRNKEKNLLLLRNNLLNNKFKTSKYNTFVINEYGKERIIYKLPYYPDRIVHHAIMNILEPIWNKLFIRNTFCCIKGRGIHDGLKRLKFDLKNSNDCTFCLKLDIKKYYPSVNHDILKTILRKKIKDKQLLILLDEIIDSCDGIPIGNYLSQFFSNLYLTYFDHWLKEEMNIKYYYRYADDIVILHNDKEFLHKIFNNIQIYLNENLKLTIKNNYQIFPVEDRGIDFLGYVIRKDYVLLRKSIKKRIFKKINKKNVYKSLPSYYGWLKHCNSHNLINKINMTKKFSDLGIKLDTTGLLMGEKIPMSKIINKDIIVKSYKLDKSKYENKQCLTIQISVDGIDRVVFTSSKILINQIEQIRKEDFPFESKIEIFNKNGYLFT